MLINSKFFLFQSSLLFLDAQESILFFHFEFLYFLEDDFVDFAEASIDENKANYEQQQQPILCFETQQHPKHAVDVWRRQRRRVSWEPEQNVKPKYRLEIQQETINRVSISADQNLDVDQNNDGFDQKGAIQFKRGVHQILINDIYGVLKGLEW